MDKMKFSLAQCVTIDCSGESGVVIARAEYVHAEPSYLVRYLNGQGVAVEAWWMEQSLRAGV
jgi:hypothetical protein